MCLYIHVYIYIYIRTFLEGQEACFDVYIYAYINVYMYMCIYAYMHLSGGPGGVL
jgi:hypothetical protein